MTKPTTLKEWDFVKDQKHNIACLTEKGLRPDEYYYQCDNEIYTPSVRIVDWEEYLKTKKI
jgi:hypothetical protein